MSESKDKKETTQELSIDHQNVIGVLSLYAVYEKLLSSEAISKEVFNSYLSKLTAFEKKILTDFLAKESELVNVIQGKVEENTNKEGGKQ